MKKEQNTEIVLYTPNKRYSKYNHNHTYFNEIDTEIKAYILGFIIADGSLDIVKRGNCITSRLCFLNSIDDLEIIEIIRKEISPEMELTYRNNQSGVLKRKFQVSLRLVSSEICNILQEKYGILQNKTLNSTFKFDFSTIPTSLIPHFIRGFFDGDGSVSFYKTNKTIYFNFSFIFNSKDFAYQIGNIFEEIFNIKAIYHEIIGKTCTYYSMRFNYSRNRTNKIKEIYNYLYNNSSIFLKRKKEKFIQYFEYRANSDFNISE